MTTTAAPAAEPVPLTQPEDAIAEMVAVLARDFNIKFSPDGLHQFVRKANGSIGAYLRKMGNLNPDIDLWNDPKFQDIREFVLNFALPHIGKALAAHSANHAAPGSAVVAEAMTSVMTSKATETQCRRATKSFQAKLPVLGELTPICMGNG